jgi:hypothetical protein
VEEVIDFDEWINSRKDVELIYWAVYDVETGIIRGIYPNNSADEFPNKIQIDTELALSIQEGTTLLSSCFVDLSADVLEISQIKSLITIDDILHRIVENKWTTETDNDIFIDYYTYESKIEVSMASKFQGTREIQSSGTNRKIHWQTDTEMLLLITDYNDPNVVYYMLSLTIADLINQNKIFEIIQLDKQFSIYTRRLFKNYVMEIK